MKTVASMLLVFGMAFLFEDSARADVVVNCGVSESGPVFMTPPLIGIPTLSTTVDAEPTQPMPNRSERPWVPEVDGPIVPDFEKQIEEFRFN